MKIVTTTCVFESGYPADKAARRLAALGFEALDMGLDYCVYADSPFLSDGYREWADMLRKTASDAGITYTHSHAPAEAGSDPIIGRSLEVAARLGARYMVLHPVWHGEDGAITEDEDEFIRRNVAAVKPWLGKAHDCGVIILSENLLWGASKDPHVICRLVCETGSPYFGWCYDTGHANCFGFKPDVLGQCSAVPLSLHVQDNYGDTRDMHLIPGDGTVDWDLFAKTLREVGYAGELVLEAHHQSLEAKDEERDVTLSRLLSKARELRGKLTK